MAGGKVNTKGLVQASGIVEVLIAMVIILVVFGMAMAIFNHVMRLSLSGQKIRAQAVLQEYLLKAEQAVHPDTETYQVDNLKITQEVKAFEAGTGLSEIHLTATDETGSKIVELQKVILNKND